jgi:hypothetical protein
LRDRRKAWSRGRHATANLKQNQTPIRGPREEIPKAGDDIRTSSGSEHDESSAARASDRRARIAEAAYHRAQLRGFAPGFEEQDWLEAEKEIEATATHQHWGERK